MKKKRIGDDIYWYVITDKLYKKVYYKVSVYVSWDVRENINNKTRKKFYKGIWNS